MESIILYIQSFIRKEPVLTAAAILALISMFFVLPDAAYTQYIDFKTLFCLLCLMISLKGIEREGLLTAVSVKLSSKVRSLKALGFLLVFTCFFASMLMTNDVALIALVPVTLAVLTLCGMERYSAFIVILQTLAANIGSSLTPFGNPQNLFLFVRYGFTLGQFLTTMIPFVLFGGVLLTIFCFFLPNQPVKQESADILVMRWKMVTMYGAMFILSVAAVFGWLPYQFSIIVIMAATFVIDKHTLVEVDYCLLLTFVAIFVFVGNVARIDSINSFISGWVQRDTMLTAVISSQFISNVPAAVMLSGFTENAAKLLVGVNVGGMGTLIASMASVISYKLYAAAVPKGTMRYLAVFTMLNALLLVLSIIFVYWLCCT